jgi:hypothetical protein
MLATSDITNAPPLEGGYTVMALLLSELNNS